MVTGRNGGHLTPGVFADFCRYQTAHGTEQAVRSFVLENRTASEMLKIIHNQHLEAAVDLVAGGHIAMFVTEQESKDAEADFAAAKLAGMNLDEVQWLSKEEMQSASECRTFI